MTLEFLLPNGDVADYWWGSIVTKFTLSAKVNRRTLVNTFVHSYSLGIAGWKTNAEFREFIAFNHEMVHYFQDLLTGIGHWDYLVRREYQPKLLTLARDLSWEQIESFLVGEEWNYPYCTDKVISLKKRLEDDLIYLPSSKYPPSRRAALAKAISSIPGMQIMSDEKPVEQAFLIENILEAEAVAITALQMFNILPSANNLQSEIAILHKSLFVPYYMSDQYATTIWFVLGSIKATFGINSDEVEKNIVITQMCFHVLTFLVDLACAHPSPYLLIRENLSKLDYEPGLKLARLLRVFLYLDVKETEKILELVLKDKDFLQAETMLLSKCKYPYLSSAQIYSDWCNVFTNMMEQDDNRILKLRYKACKYRVSQPNTFVYKDFGISIDAKIPLFFLTPFGLESNGFDWDYLDYDEWTMLTADIMRNRKELSLVNFFFGTGRFVCPLAETQSCDAATPNCFSGITATSQFPRAPNCLVRDGLEQASWLFPDSVVQKDNGQENNLP